MRGGSRKEIEITGADVEDAIARGLASLGVSREKAQIEILDEGSRGLLGLGRRDAVVRLRVIGADVSGGPKSRRQESRREARKPAAAPKPTPVETRPPAPKPKQRDERKREERKPKPAPRKEAPAPPPKASPEARPVAAGANAGTPWPETEAADQEALTSETDVAREIWETLLDKLQVEADVAVKLSEPDERTGRQIPIIDVTGRDLSVLIGPRGDTLNAMQFVTRIMVAHRLKRRSYFVVDVEGYRERRGQALTRLAERMAEKALKRGRPITLEPMPPNERRIIHMALRDVEGVSTQSTGEGSGRRVRILLS